jgi:hypothetical protein
MGDCSRVGVDTVDCVLQCVCRANQILGLASEEFCSRRESLGHVATLRLGASHKGPIEVVGAIRDTLCRA